jgi:UDP-2,3-diacylglucosamine pyrophosphatase LpxH
MVIKRYEEAGADLARRQGYDGIICGHLHFPSVLNIDGIVYCNDGDWVENCTPLVQDFDGNLRLVAHRFDHY